MKRIAFTACVALTAAAHAGTPLVIDAGHWDIEVETVFGASPNTVDEIELILANEESDVPGDPNFGVDEIEADEGILVPGNERVQNGALGGISDGSTVYFIPEVRDVNTLWLGIGSEETGPGVFENDSLNLELVGYNGPGNFVLSQDDGFGGNVIFMDSSDGLSGDEVAVSAVGDGHYDFAFDALGTYELTMQATGTLTSAFGGGTISTDPTTYTFVVPEPASLALLGVAGVIVRRRR